MEIRIRFFAILRDLTGEGELHWKLEEGENLSRLFDRLAEKYPKITPFKSALRYAANESYVRIDYVPRAGDEIALIPPISGG